MEIVFDIQRSPPSGEEIERRRTELGILGGGWGGGILFGVFFALIGMVIFADWIAARIIIIFFMMFCLLVAFIVFSIKKNKKDELKWLDPEQNPAECIALNKWCEKDGVLRIYLGKVAAMGRKPVIGEYRSALKWMAGVDERKKIEKAHQACKNMSALS